jgi:hypothetical protein
LLHFEGVVFSKNSIRIDWGKESLNVSAHDRAGSISSVSRGLAIRAEGAA